jgi:hypothetical protein
VGETQRPHQSLLVLDDAPRRLGEAHDAKLDQERASSLGVALRLSCQRSWTCWHWRLSQMWTEPLPSMAQSLHAKMVGVLHTTHGAVM